MDTTGTGSFTGKVAFVTGAASGIGRAAALAFARAGASVVVADVSEQGNQQTARMIEQQGGRALAVQCDVRRVDDGNEVPFRIAMQLRGDAETVPHFGECPIRPDDQSCGDFHRLPVALRL